MPRFEARISAGPAETSAYGTDIRKPALVQREIYVQMENNENRKFDRVRAPSSTRGRTTAELQTLGSSVARSRPAAAKDVSMAGLVGTLGMLAEASGCGAVLDVADVVGRRQQRGRRR